MTLKTLKAQLAAVTLVAASFGLSPATATASESDFCYCIAECWTAGGQYSECIDYCAGIHMTTLCAKAAVQIDKDRR